MESEYTQEFEAWQKASSEWEIDMAIWEAVRHGIVAAITERIKHGEFTGGAEERLRAHYRNAPERPEQPNVQDFSAKVDKNGE